MSEEQIQRQICNYISTFYPDIIFLSDLSGIKLSMYQAKKIRDLKSCRGIPDLLILEPRNNYHGLLIEIKKDGVRVLKKDGKVPKNDHLQEQWKVVNNLRLKGYYATFCIGYAHTKKIIDDYLNQKK